MINELILKIIDRLIYNDNNRYSCSPELKIHTGKPSAGFRESSDDLATLKTGLSV